MKLLTAGGGGFSWALVAAEEALDDAEGCVVDDEDEAEVAAAVVVGTGPLFAAEDVALRDPQESSDVFRGGRAKSVIFLFLFGAS